MTDLRCQSKKHGELQSGLVEVKCNSRFCGAGSGVVVIHKFDALSGDLLSTQRYRDPNYEEVDGGDRRHSTTVRTA